MIAGSSLRPLRLGCSVPLPSRPNCREVVSRFDPVQIPRDGIGYRLSTGPVAADGTVDHVFGRLPFGKWQCSEYCSEVARSAAAVCYGEVTRGPDRPARGAVS